MKSVSIIGVTSYTGVELLRLLSQHPEFVVTSATARSAVGKRLDEIFPQLAAIGYEESKAKSPIDPLGGKFPQLASVTVGREEGHRAAVDPSLIITEEPGLTDLAFVCLPHAAAAESVVKLLERGVKVVDLSADFRLRDVKVYEEWYKHTHPAPALLETAVYGLCERYRERIQNTSLVANPGCHVTTALLGLIPAFANGLVERDVIIDSKTGISGAGRSLALPNHFAEANEGVDAYGLSGHRHMPEIKQELEAAAADGGYPIANGLRITFVPHRIPMTRGILATSYTDLKLDSTGRAPTTAEVRAIYKQYYADEPFVHVVDQPPQTKWTYGSNHCFVHPIVDTRTNRLIVVSCLDNLVKGAAGQAIQCANRVYGFPEIMGIANVGMYP